MSLPAQSPTTSVSLEVEWPAWRWPVDLSRYLRRPELTGEESSALARLGTGLRRRPGPFDRRDRDWKTIEEHLRPLDEVRGYLWCPDSESQRRGMSDAIALILMAAGRRGRTFWSWAADDWLQLIGTSATAFRTANPGWAEGTARVSLVAYAYLLADFTDLHRLGGFQRPPLSWRVFGKPLVDQAQQQVTQVLEGWGYRIESGFDPRITPVICLSLLLNRSPLVEDLTTEAFARLRLHPAMAPKNVGALHAVQRAVASLGHCDPPPSPYRGRMPAIEGTAGSWADWVERWYTTSTLSPKARGNTRIVLSKIGRWLAEEHPEITEPAHWTRQTCASWVATVDRMRIGDHVQRHEGLAGRAGQPITAHTKSGYLTATRAFFRDCQEWEWIPRRFDPFAPWPLPGRSRGCSAPTHESSPTGSGPNFCGPE